MVAEQFFRPCAASGLLSTHETPPAEQISFHQSTIGCHKTASFRNLNMDAKTPEVRRETTGPLLAERLAGDRERQNLLFAYGFVRFQFSRDDLQEAMQETIVELMQMERPVSNPEALVQKIFHVRCLRLLSRRTAKTEPESMEDEPPCPINPSRRIHQHLLVKQGFARISRFCREILISHYIEGNSLRETAERVGRAYSGVSKLISRCLRRLKECLEQ